MHGEVVAAEAREDAVDSEGAVGEAVGGASRLDDGVGEMEAVKNQGREDKGLGWFSTYSIEQRMAAVA